MSTIENKNINEINKIIKESNDTIVNNASVNNSCHDTMQKCCELFAILCSCLYATIMTVLYAITSFITIFFAIALCIAFMDYYMFLDKDTEAYFFLIIPKIIIRLEYVPKGLFVTSYVRAMMFIICMTISIIVSYMIVLVPLIPFMPCICLLFCAISRPY